MNPAVAQGWEALAAGRLADAERVFSGIVASDPADGDALLGLAAAFWHGGHRLAAAGAARRAALTRPDHLESRLTLGTMLRAIGNFAGALPEFEAALRLDEGNPVTLRELAAVYGFLQRPEDALRAALAARERDPSSAASVVCLADALLANERPAEAAAAYREALQRDPGAHRAATGLGRVALERARWDDARSAFEHALAIAPGDADARYERALLDVRYGRYAAGFAAFGAIMDTESNAARYYYALCGVPVWDGSPLAGRRLVIASEQGLGDHVMMARFFAGLPAVGTSVTVEAPSPLLTLFERSFPSVRFIERTHLQSPAAMDVHLPIMQLPRLFGIASESDISGARYLRADPRRVDAYRAMLGAEPNLRHVGIVWRGNPKHAQDRRRAAPLEHWAALAALGGVRFHSLQFEAGDAELDAAPFPLAPAHRSIRDLDDTAALMSALDAVVSVDTASVHVAGALGRPVWLANPLVGDFRWGIARSDSPWYAGLRIARQARAGEWAPVFETIAAELSAHFARPG